ncbi:MAG: ribosome recycling factor, partial [Sphingomonadaceae bacterium]|nr:ribosome recycling factor [Sphingomonadaceae bacterium]
NPQTNGTIVMLPIPELNEERRRELTRVAAQYAEHARVAIRNVRRDGMEDLKDDEKKKEISEDDRKRSEDDVQKLTDKYVAECDAAAAAKEKEILTQ